MKSIEIADILLVITNIATIFMGPADRDVGAKIRAFRQRKKLSLNDLSRATGIAPSNLSSMNGEIVSHAQHSGQNCKKHSA